MKHMNYITARTLAAILGVSLWLTPFTSMAEEWKRVDGVYRMADGTAIPDVKARGIDISHWNQNIDWNQVASDDVEFVMLGTRYKGAVDPNFRVNAAGAAQAGLSLGAYIYSYATTTAMAEQEADFILDLIKDYPISFPVVFDAEDTGSLGTLTPSQVSQVINAFCKKIQDAGYYPMVYANEYWLNNKIDLSMIDYDIWVARYNVMYTYQNPAMWQATSNGSVKGINGNVDINFLYKDFSTVIPADTWRTIQGKRYYYKNHLMQKSAWIHDGEGWYYMDAAGNPSKGWLSMPEGSYYLDQTTGKMAQGFQKLDETWRYFDPSGIMATGWREVDGSWYYLDSQGEMKSGWQEINGRRYYLGQSGTMQTGWQHLGGSWYYLGDAGDMKTGWRLVDNTWYYLDSSGVMQTGWQKLDNDWYYLSQSGAMRTGWRQSDGFWYYLEPSGKMATGWVDVNGTWYYLNESGVMLTGWQEINHARYYLDPSSGAMAANTTVTVDGVSYQADENGVCTPVAAESPETSGAEAPAPQTPGDTGAVSPESPSTPEPSSEGVAGVGPGFS